MRMVNHNKTKGVRVMKLMKIDKIFNTAMDKNFVEFCAKLAPEAGITPEEWADSKKKTAFILLMAKLESDIEESYKTWEA